MRLEDIFTPDEEDFQHYTNGDAIDGFLEREEGEYIVAGDILVLPDVNQVVTVREVRFFKSQSGRPVLYFDLETVCAVPGCENLVQFSKTVFEWRKSPYIRRCCTEHLGQWRTPIEFAWMRSDERKARLGKRRPLHTPHPKGEAKRAPLGGVEAEVRAVLDLVEPVGVEALIQAAAAGLPKPSGRDTRRQVVARAVLSLQRRGLLKLGPDDLVRFAS